MSGKYMQISCRQARQIDIVGYLYSLGYEPEKIRGNTYWFLSPLRREKTASFKVIRSRNLWYDFGEGNGGNFIDFAVLYYRCTVSELLAMLNAGQLLLPAGPAPAYIADQDNRIIITNVSPLTHPALLQYCSKRGIDIEVAKRYCGQAQFTNNGKSYFAICFKNNLGGYELRNAYFKGSSSPKSFTLIESGLNSLVVFEGFFDFLSFLILREAWHLPAMDYLILNSLSFLEKALPIMDQYAESNLFLDNNAAGRLHTAKAVSRNTKFKDQSYRYSSHEDLNEYLCFLGQNRDTNTTIILKPP